MYLYIFKLQIYNNTIRKLFLHGFKLKIYFNTIRKIFYTALD